MQTKAKKHIFIFGLLFISVMGHAQTSQGTYAATNNNFQLSSPGMSFHVQVVTDRDSSFRMTIQNPEKRKLQVSIYHSVLGMVTDTIIDREDYSCRFNFSNAEDGMYKVVVRNRKEKFMKEIVLNTISTRNLLIR